MVSDRIRAVVRPREVSGEADHRFVPDGLRRLRRFTFDAGRGQLAKRRGGLV